MSATKLTRREQRAQAQHFIDTLEAPPFPTQNAFISLAHNPACACRCVRFQLSPTLIGGSKEQPQYEENEAIPPTTPPARMAIRRLPLTCSKGWQNYASHGSMRAAIPKNLPCAVPITLKRGWRMMASTSYVLAAY